MRRLAFHPAATKSNVGANCDGGLIWLAYNNEKNLDASPSSRSRMRSLSNMCHPKSR